jgi:hypothetical protein
MLIRRLVALLLVLGVFAGASVPVTGADKDKEKEKPAKDETKGKPVTLEWKFEKGKTFYQTMTTKTVQSMKVMNNDVNQTQNQTFYFSWTPTKVEKDKVTLEQVIIGVIMDIEIGGSKISYNSTTDNAANNPLGDFFKALKDSKFTIELNTKTYKVEKIEGRDEFLKKLTAANPQMKPLLDVILSPEALKEMAEPIFNVVPTEPVTKGKTWKKTTTLNMGPIGTYDTTYKYTYEGPEAGGEKLDKIKVDTELTYQAPKEVAGQGGLPFKIKAAKLASSKPVGEILFNAKKGRVEKMTNKLELSGELTIEIGGQTTTVKLSQTQDSTVTTSDTDPIKKK